jgi:putative ABC transport system ATP-binding protein
MKNSDETSLKTVISVKNLNKTFFLGDSKVKALNNIDFDIIQGQKVAITGSSGSGKSTLMNVLGCLMTPDSGDYFLNTEKISGLSNNELAGIRNRLIGFVFQSFNLLPRLTALENVELPLLYQNHRDAKNKALEALKIVGLENRSHHEPNQLSGGQRKRVAIARAIVTNPAIILADEPTGNLDSKTEKEIMEIFDMLNNKGSTIIIVTHEPSIAASCPRILKMKDGFLESENF